MMINEHGKHMEMKFRAPESEGERVNSSVCLQGGNSPECLYKFETQEGMLFSICRALGLEGSFYVTQVDVRLEEAHDGNLGDWDPCGFVLGPDHVVGHMKLVVAEKKRAAEGML